MALISSNSVNKTGYVQKELKLALEQSDKIPFGSIYIIPIRLEKCEVIEPRIIDLHWVDLFPNYDESLNKIVNSLKQNVA